ncbi:MAG: beta/gamma crystallin domain-containing protein [Nostoc sp. ChiQUE01a]|nr:beta/gamma crystallin domain-containing protein [Nostoc sp. ChiQUE01a]
MSNNEATFFEEKNYQGNAHPYLKDQGDQSTCTDSSGSLNDKFLSVKVGELVKVLAWQHCNASGIYEEWDKDNPDLSSIGGLSRFRVVDTSNSVVAFRLVDQSGGGKSLSLKCQTDQVGESTYRTADGNDEYRIIGSLPTNQPNFPPLTTGVYLRLEEPDYSFLSTGTVYIKWNNDQNKAELTYQEETKPPGFEFKQTGSGTFDFIWVGK